MHASITSVIDYCNSLLYGLPANQLDKIQRVQNTAARIIFRPSNFQSSAIFIRHFLANTRCLNNNELTVRFAS